jgi:peptidoglycan hydrolase-like amidase
VVSENGSEPIIRVGLLSGAGNIRFAFDGTYKASTGETFEGGEYTATSEGGSVRLIGTRPATARRLTFTPASFDSSRATVYGVTIGIDFHWQRKESQQFQGALTLTPTEGSLMLINELPLESYLVSVISSEMSASCPEALLRAHATVSRSWLLAQTRKRYQEVSGMVHEETPAPYGDDGRIIRWYDRESHADFDVCADDHCQRYHGISKAFSESAFSAVRETRGVVLLWGDEVCDARYSKSCGGFTEEFAAAWEDRDVPYLAAVYDGPGDPPVPFLLPLSNNDNATKWITGSPAAFCNTGSVELLERILPGFDRETRNFFRWELSYTNEELQEILFERTGISFGPLRGLEALERGKSGRITRLLVDGALKRVVIGKELEIRRSLSRSHLYSSAFVVSPLPNGSSDYPGGFKLTGAGWGHGVGLCQIGAAVMADRGYSHEQILNHYFRGASLQSIY